MACGTSYTDMLTNDLVLCALEHSLVFHKVSFPHTVGSTAFGHPIRKSPSLKQRVRQSFSAMINTLD